MTMTLLRTLCLSAPLALAASLSQAQTLKISSPTNNDVTLQWMQSFESRVEAATGGAIDVQPYPANQLGQIPATIEGVSMGIIEVTAPASSFFVQYDRRFEALDVPGLFTDLGHAQRTLSDPAVLDRIASWGSDQGLETLAVYPHGPLGIVSTRAVDTTSALSGQRIRVAGPSAMQTGPFRLLGASPMSMPLGEVLPAMQNGVVDGAIAGLPVFTTGRYYDVAQDLTVLPESYLIVAAVASTAFLEAIGDERADALRMAAREALADANAWNLTAVDAVMGIWQQNGGRLLELSEEDQGAFLQAVAEVLPEANAQNAALQAEVDFLREVAARHASQ
jgi:TRAP-type transport system periplasmic protein